MAARTTSARARADATSLGEREATSSAADRMPLPPLLPPPLVLLLLLRPPSTHARKSSQRSTPLSAPDAIPAYLHTASL